MSETMYVFLLVICLTKKVENTIRLILFEFTKKVIIRTNE